MKIRTDFVTNSSSSSFLVFHIRNKELFDYLRTLGIRFENTEDGVLTDDMTVILPSGASMTFCKDLGECSYEFSTSFNSVSAWLVGILLEFDPVKEDDDYTDFAVELRKLLSDAGVLKKEWETMQSIEELADALSGLDAKDGAITSGHIAQVDAFEGEIYHSEEIDIHGGERTVRTYSDEDGTLDFEDGDASEVGRELSNRIYDGDKAFFGYVKEHGLGSASTEKWNNGRWKATDR